MNTMNHLLRGTEMFVRHKFHLRVVPNVGDIVPLISKYIVESPGPADVKVRQEAMKCFQVCISSCYRRFNCSCGSNIFE